MNTGSALARFNITLSKAVAEPVQVEWHTSDGTAKASVDYAANKGTVVFAPGETAKTVDILVYGRAVGAEDRSFYVEMLPPTNAILGASIGECIVTVDTSGSTPVTQIIVPTGPVGPTGKSAYQSYLDTTTDNPPMTEAEWVESLNGDPAEIAKEVAPLIDVGETTLIAEGTESLGHPDETTVKAIARRVAYAAETKIATLVLADGDNTISESDLVGDNIKFSAIGFFPKVLSSGLLMEPEWDINPNGSITIKNVDAGDVLYAIEYDFISENAVENKIRISALDREHPGADIAADSKIQEFLKNIGLYTGRAIFYETVSDLIVGKSFGSDVPFVEQMIAVTLSNQHGITITSSWRISETKDVSTYSVALANGKYANLMLRGHMGFEEFGFGGTDPAANSAAVDEACRVARANPAIKKLSFPSGTFSANLVTLDVDRRGFTFSGAGNDATIIMSAVSDISLHHVGIDPRDRNRDRLHWHQTVEGFTINGNVSDKGANAATRAIYTAPYTTIRNKSINHRVSNYDLLHLVMYWNGHSQGTTNGTTSTKYGVRVRNNSIKLMGYIGSSAVGQCTVSVEGMSTTLTVAAAINDTAVTVADASGFDTWFEIAFTNSTGGVETRRITAIAGNVLTLDRSMSSAFPSGAKVEVPILGTAITASTIETGEIRIGDSQSTTITGNYSEEAKWVLRKYIRGLVVKGNSAAESSPAMLFDAVDRRSTFDITDNDFTFSIALNIKDRSGVVGDRIDLYNAPSMNIQRSTRVQNPILVNGVYALSSLRIEKTFDTVAQDNRFTKMTFSGFNHVAPAGGSVTEVMKFFHDTTQFGFDGYTFDLDITCRRDGASAAVTPGLLKRYGTSSAAPAAQNASPVSLFADFNATTGYDVFIGASSNRGVVQIRPNPSSAIKATISGVVTSII